MTDMLFPQVPPVSRRVWFAIVGPPLAWATQGLVGWFVDFKSCPVTTAVCAPTAGGQLRWLEIVITLLALSVPVVGFMLTAVTYRRSPGAGPTAVHAVAAPDFLRTAGLLISLVFALGIIFAGLPSLLLSTCARVR